MESTEPKKATPPYVSYRTLANFIDKYTETGLPGRIERGIMGTLSGAVQSQLTTTLKYMGLVSENHIPTEDLKRLVAAKGTDRAAVLKTLVVKNYPFIFTPDFDFSKATGSMVRERFEEFTNATGETVTRCIAFLKDAAEDAGIPVSPFLSHKTASNGAAKKKASARKAERTERRSAQEPSPVVPATPVATATPSIEAQKSLLLWGAFQRLPTPGAAWKKTDREQWLIMLTSILAMEYPEHQP